MRNIPKDLIENKTYVVTYVVYLDSDAQKRYFYIAVRKDKLLEFQRAVIEGNFDAEDYGIVLEEGEGEASDVVKEKMKMMYQCDNVFATDITGPTREERR